MAEIWAIVFGLSVLLAIAVVLQPVSKFLKLPHTVVLAAVGAGLALGAQALGIDLGAVVDHGAGSGDHHGEGHLPAWKQAIGAMTGIDITAEVILFVFLPALVFESSLSLDLRKLTKDLSVILFLAIAGVLISTTLVGLVLSSYSGIAVVACLLVGAIISATDPVAVIALFKDLGAPKRLTILVEGESLFNDATAIVVATLLLTVLTSNTQPDIGIAALDFLRVFGVGILVGMVIARVLIEIMVPFKGQAISVVSLSLIMPFVAFVVAEHFLHVSGVMASVVCGLALGSHGRKVIPPQIFEEIEHAWHQLAFWATALIFILVGLAVPGLLIGSFVQYVDEALILFAVGTLVRTLIIFGFIPILSGVGLTDKVSRAFQAIMVWGGLRGAVSLALALVVLDTPGVDPELKNFVAVLVTVFVLATLLLQATTISTVMKLLGLDKLAPVDQTMRARSLAWARRSVRDELSGMVDRQSSDPAQLATVLDSYDAAADAAEQSVTSEALGHADWVRMGLSLAIAQERQFYLEAYGDGAVSSSRLRELLSRNEDLSEYVRTAGTKDDLDLSALEKTTEKTISYYPRFTRALWMQRTLGMVNPLADAIATRFSTLSAMRAALHRQKDDGLSDICALLPPEASEAFVKLYNERSHAVDRAHSALVRQYPAFAGQVDRRNLARAGFRLEALAYDRLKDNGMISPEVHGNLLAELESQTGKSKLPRLRLSYDPVELVGHVPMFAALTTAERKKIAAKLTTIFYAPGETIIRTGDPGDSMFFIADGAVEVLLPDGTEIDLGTGEVIGEMALLTEQPRTADVISEGFSTLLKLSKKEFERVKSQNPKLAQQIEAIARSRQKN